MNDHVLRAGSQYRPNSTPGWEPVMISGEHLGGKIPSIFGTMDTSTGDVFTAAHCMRAFETSGSTTLNLRIHEYDKVGSWVQLDRKLLSPAFGLVSDVVRLKPTPDPCPSNTEGLWPWDVTEEVVVPGSVQRLSNPVSIMHSISGERQLITQKMQTKLPDGKTVQHYVCSKDFALPRDSGQGWASADNQLFATRGQVRIDDTHYTAVNAAQMINI